MPKVEYTDEIVSLKADHRKFEVLFEQFEKARADKRKQAITQEICNELKSHTMIEEEVFYPSFREKIDKDTRDEAYVEHDGAKVLINDIESLDPGADFCGLGLDPDAGRHDVGATDRIVEAGRCEVSPAYTEQRVNHPKRAPGLAPLARSNSTGSRGFHGPVKL